MDESRHSGSSRAFLTERFDAGINAQLAMDELSAEEPLEILVRFRRGAHQVERVVSVTMRTPGLERELALGFLVTEGVLRDPGSVESLTVDPDEQNRVIVTLSQPIELERLQRNFYTTSSCGICGKASLAAVAMHHPVQLQADRPAIPVDLLYSLPERLNRAQPTFRLTGGLHAAALFNVSGQVMGACEDVGRHNAVDKLIGLQLLQGKVDFSEFVLALSGRAGFELVQKSLMAGIPAVAAVGAPSSLAVELARAHDQTLVGFLREQRFNVYSGRRRIVGGRAEDDKATEPSFVRQRLDGRRDKLKRRNGDGATGRQRRDSRRETWAMYIWPYAIDVLPRSSLVFVDWLGTHRPSSSTSLPEAVMNTVKAESSTATIDQVDTYTWAGTTIYRVVLKLNDKPYMELHIAETGKLVREDSLASQKDDMDGTDDGDNADDNVSPTPSPKKE